MAFRTATKAKICKQEKKPHTHTHLMSFWQSLCVCVQLTSASVSHHDREDDGSYCRLEDPEQGQTQALDEGEEVDASLGDVP